MAGQAAGGTLADNVPGSDSPGSRAR